MTEKSIQNIAAIGIETLEGQRWQTYGVYKDSGVEWLGTVPKHWDVRRLKFIAPLRYGDSLPADSRREGRTLVFGSNGPVGFHSCANTSAPVLVVGRKGSFGKVSYSKESCFAIDTTYFIDTRSTKSDIRWLFYALSLLELDSLSMDSAIPGLSREFAHEKKLPLPLLSEQRTIAAFLDYQTSRIDALITKKEQHITLLQEKRAALISHAVTKGLNADVPMKDSGVEWLGMVPEHWNVRKLKRLVTKMIAGPFGSSLTKDMYTKEGYKVYGQEQVIPANFFIGDYFVPEEIYHTMLQYAIEPGDILISCVGTFGKIAVVPPDAMPGIINPRLAKLIPDKRIITSTYLGLLLKSKIAFEQMERLSRGGTMGVLNLGLLSHLLLPLPPLAEQQTIITYLGHETQKIDALISTITEGIKKLQEYRTALISVAVTGKIDVRGVVAEEPDVVESAAD